MGVLAPCITWCVGAVSNGITNIFGTWYRIIAERVVWGEDTSRGSGASINGARNGVVA